MLRRFAFRAVRDPELARELVQETMLAGLANAASFAQQSSARTWLIGIFSHKAADYFRRTARHPEAEFDERVMLSTPSAEDVERTVSARQRLTQVERALSQLPDSERLAILLVDVEGLEREAVCHSLEVTATHLRVLLHRGRNRLRKALEHDEPTVP